MNLIQQIAKRFTTTRSLTDLSPWAQSWMRGGEIDDSSNRLTAPYSQSAWIYVAISVLAENVAQVPFRISRGRGQGEEILTEGPVVELFRRPHPTMSRNMFWETLVGWEALRGEFFVVPMDDQDRPVSLGQKNSTMPVRMLPLSPDYFCHLIHEDNLAGWRYSALRGTSPVTAQVLLPEEVIHSRNFNPYLYWRGLSPITIAMLAAASDYAASQYMKGLMMNNGDGGLVVTTDQIPDERQREQILAALRDRKRRVGTADRPLFLWGGAKIATPTMASADSNFVEQRKLNRQEICSIYKVPESVIGAADQRNSLGGGGAAEQDRLTFIENTIGAICRRLEAALEPIIKTFGPDLHGWFDLDSLPVMQTARLQRLTTAQKAFAMGVPFNAINEIYRLGFQPLPWGDKGYLPKGLMELGTLAKPAKQKRTVIKNQDATEKLLALLEESQPAPDGRLKKFLFEQRNRVLNNIEAGCETSFDLVLENEKLLTRLKPESEDEKSRLLSLNQTTAQSITNAMDSGGDVLARVKEIFAQIEPD